MADTGGNLYFCVMLVNTKDSTSPFKNKVFINVHTSHPFYKSALNFCSNY